MSREELKEIVCEIIERLKAADSVESGDPQPACIFGDDLCPNDLVVLYAVPSD